MRENVMSLRDAVRPSERFMAAKRGVNGRLEFELGAWFEGSCGFALVLALEPDDGAQKWPRWPYRSAPVPQST